MSGLAPTRPATDAAAIRASVVIPAYNLARYLPAAIDSALAQEPCGGPVEIIVVDDGSTDETPRILERYADRVRIIRTPNGGLVSALNTGLAAARGAFIGLLDADDEWPADRLRCHLEILEADPGCGLVHGDMEVIDAAGATIHESFFGWCRLPVVDGRILGPLLRDNLVTASALTVRASLLPAICPILPEAVYPDWWIAACVAAVAEIRTAPGIASRYRWHDSNMCLGSDGTKRLALERRELPFRRWMMRELVSDETVTAAHVTDVLGRWRAALTHAGLSSEDSVRTMLSTDPAAATHELATAQALPAGIRRCQALVRALAHDPFDGALSVDADVACRRARQLEGSTPAPAPAPSPLIALQARTRLVVARLDELLDDPGLLSAFAAGPDVASETLTILAAPGEALQALVALVDADPALSDDRCDLQVIHAPQTLPARRLLAARAAAVLTGSAPAGYLTGVPLHAAAGSVVVA